MDDMLINNGTLPASDEYSVPSQLSADVQELRRQLSQRDQELHSLQAELDRVRSGLNRRRLPPTRDSLTHKFKVGQHEGYMTVGLYEDGHPGELFLTMAKEGSTVGGLMDTIGILTSLVLQYGVPVDALARKFEYVRFEPSGQTRDAQIGDASSVIDYIFRWLGMRFSDMYRQEKAANAIMHDTGSHDCQSGFPADPESKLSV